MRILFVASQVYLPQLYGGVQTSTDELCCSLIARGHTPSLLVKAMPGGWFGFLLRAKMRINKFRLGKSAARDRKFGYSVWRAWYPEDVVDYVSKKENPDLIVVMTGGKLLPLARKVQQTSLPILVQLHDVAFEEYGDAFLDFGDVAYVANSEFTARKYWERYKITAHVINPFVAVARYCSGDHRQNVTFINPVYEKGLDLALEIAELSLSIPFVFVEGWTLNRRQRKNLNSRLKNLSNVRLLPSQSNMAAVYSKCKILIVPSLFEETFGRVVAEAQANGIPVLAMKRGGLPETVGEGGVIFDINDAASVWAYCLKKLWHDEKKYLALSRFALSHAGRAAMDHGFQTEMWEKAFTQALNSSPASEAN